jgi:excisionase family DNA binding protein
MMRMMLDDRLLRPWEVADRLSVSRSEAYRLIKAGKVPSMAIDEGRGQLRVRLSDLTTFMASLPPRPIGTVR